jgi:hypothetical protein
VCVCVIAYLFIFLCLYVSLFAVAASLCENALSTSRQCEQIQNNALLSFFFSSFFLLLFCITRSALVRFSNGTFYHHLRDLSPSSLFCFRYAFCFSSVSEFPSTKRCTLVALLSRSLFFFFTTAQEQ